MALMVKVKRQHKLRSGHAGDVGYLFAELEIASHSILGFLQRYSWKL